MAYDTLISVVQDCVIKLRSDFISNIITIMLYGIYLPIFLKSVLLISPKLRSNVPSRWLLALILTLFIPTTARLVTGICGTLARIQFASVGHEDDPVLTTWQNAGLIGRSAKRVYNLAGYINVWLIDVIVVWRAYTLLPHHPRLRDLLVALSIFTLFFNAILMIDSSRPFLFYSVPGNLVVDLGIAPALMALSVTVFGTACIGWTAWKYKKSIKASQFRLRTTSFISRTFRVLIEGCIVLALLQISVISLNFRHARIPGSSVPYILLHEITIFASAIHPCLVTVLVSDESRNSQSVNAISAADLSIFAVAPPTLGSSIV
ncbi:hypothetical protein DL96DRAFT_243493 [Flagelloscypha sp. PMI_526]|nr:hypothetical protein DL96DRAFT_243493 [Flagelloscypha sp. PMI_526]